MNKYTSHGELSHEEVARRAKGWAIGNNILEQMRKQQEPEWEIKRIHKQSKLNLDYEY